MTTKELWAGVFGNDYVKRNMVSEENIAARIDMWHKVFFETPPTFGKEPPKTILEVGCGQGQNLIAISRLTAQAQSRLEFSGLEPNAEAVKACSDNLFKESLPWTRVLGDAAKIEAPDYNYDMVITSGVLIHIPPDDLLAAMKEIYRVSKHYIICAEYFSAEPRELTYHGEQALWTRDFGAMWLDNFKLRCSSVQFFWKRITGIDNLTVWVFEKVN